MTKEFKRDLHAIKIIDTAMSNVYDRQMDKYKLNGEKLSIQEFIRYSYFELQELNLYEGEINWDNVHSCIKEEWKTGYSERWNSIFDKDKLAEEVNPN